MRRAGVEVAAPEVAREEGDGVGVDGVRLGGGVVQGRAGFACDVGGLVGGPAGPGERQVDLVGRICQPWAGSPSAIRHDDVPGAGRAQVLDERLAQPATQDWVGLFSLLAPRP
ncbi:hypothetical protein QRX50_23250 [Amycolatopsis carbonis]|uniref:Uncharacterized protein n=1 Tax=Amycolatopsis carbonis TaxID=715471 RepID=A0A9Y2IRH9_9PSEU|nr:hypothetical protein [Amycolatopsis sp. 2-15]WIX83463.1 hypothetical protein QRX50_23250 [Amycolatopsis sp. 2-15]